MKNFIVFICVFFNNLPSVAWRNDFSVFTFVPFAWSFCLDLLGENRRIVWQVPILWCCVMALEVTQILNVPTLQIDELY